uniref:ABC transporter family G domain-containing protein n=1 Tax=Zooxanthella nutricula TaxID=1333877 RepID=A0A7S2VSS7_9DINO
MSLDSARKLVEVGQMQVAEQHLADTDVFGRYLAELWVHQAGDYGASEEDTYAPLPSLAPRGCNWGEAMMAQLRRVALQMFRTKKNFALLGCMMATGVFAVVLGLPVNGFLPNTFLQPAFAVFFMMLTHGVMAQRTFGGHERVIAWREAGAGANMIMYFAGRDLASLVDILVGAAFFTMIYWPAGTLLCSFHAIFWVSFAFLYASGGLAFLWSILCSPSNAQLLFVVNAFLCFLLSGFQPAFIQVLQGTGFLMSVSPIRWAMGFLVGDHLYRTGAGSTGGTGVQFNNPYVNFFNNASLSNWGAPVAWMNQNEWSCRHPRMATTPVGHRWVGDPATDRPPISISCSNVQLYLIGIYFRLLSVVALVATSKIRANGGGAVISGPGRSTSARRMQNVLFFAFLLALSYFMWALLLHSF